MKIIFDYNRTLFDPETNSLYPGAISLLKYLLAKNTLFLVSRNEPGRGDRLLELGIKKYFQRIVFVEEKTEAILKNLIENSDDVILVGDRIKEEIHLGNKLGFITIWIKQGKFSPEIPTKHSEQPDHTLDNIRQLRNIISKYEN